MKHIIEFDLSGDDQWEEKRKLKQYLDAEEYAIFIWDVFQSLRNEIKYNEELSEETIDVIEKLRNEFIDNLEERNISYVLEG